MDTWIHTGMLTAIVALGVYVGRQEMKIRMLWKHYCKTVIKEDVNGE